MVAATRAALVALLLAAAGCGGSSKAHDPTEGPHTMVLKAACPGAHLAIDNLVASDPASQAVFVDQLRRLRDVATNDTREALDPLIKAAVALQAAGIGEGFYKARDDVHEAVVGLDGHCVKAGSFILH